MMDTEPAGTEDHLGWRRVNAREQRSDLASLERMRLRAALAEVTGWLSHGQSGLDNR